MDGDRIINILKDFGLSNRAFTLWELLEIANPKTGHKVFRNILLNDKRFVFLSRETSGECFFILDSTLFRWFSYLNVRLAIAHLSRLNAHQLKLHMSSLRIHRQWEIIPLKAIEFGRQYGFIYSTSTPECFFFPLAGIFSYLSPFRLTIAKSILRSFAEKENRVEALQKPIEYWIERTLSRFNDRIVYVIKQREGILAGVKYTLDEIGSDMGISRERVRQIESEFWENIRLLRYHRIQVPLVEGFLCEMLRQKNSLLTTAKSSSLACFVAKCIEIPCVEIPNIGLIIFGAKLEDIASLANPEEYWPYYFDTDKFKDSLESEIMICLSDSDLNIICEKIVTFYKEHLTMVKKVNLVLQTIGRPAHYSEVTEEYNRLFPDDLSNENNIHSVLSRGEHGVVWIGAKGMFALEEWGYHRPEKKLFDTIAEIVEKIYGSTNRPVHFQTIVAEIGKYRSLVNRSSLIFATHFNPNLQRVSKDYFIPKKPGDEIDDEISVDELDSILRDFEKRS